jgi:hypothetical protein
MVGVYSFVGGGICRVFTYCVPDFCVVIFQYLLSSIDRDVVVSDSSSVSPNCFGQAVCLLVTFQTRVSFDRCLL